jgi:hypothetical protein
LNEGLDEGCEIYQQHLLSASCHIFGNNSIQETKPRWNRKERAFKVTVHTSASSLQLEPKLVASRLVFPTRILNIQEPPASVERVSRRQAYCHVAKLRQL